MREGVAWYGTDMPKHLDRQRNNGIEANANNYLFIFVFAEEIHWGFGDLMRTIDDCTIAKRNMSSDKFFFFKIV